VHTQKVFEIKINEKRRAIGQLFGEKTVNSTFDLLDLLALTINCHGFGYIEVQTELSNFFVSLSFCVDLVSGCNLMSTCSISLIFWIDLIGACT